MSCRRGIACGLVRTRAVDGHRRTEASCRRGIVLERGGLRACLRRLAHGTPVDANKNVQASMPVRPIGRHQGHLLAFPRQRLALLLAEARAEYGAAATARVHLPVSFELHHDVHRPVLDVEVVHSVAVANVDTAKAVQARRNTGE